jgi:hypothetical protein
MAIRTGSVVDTCWARTCFISYSLRCTAAYKSSGRPREEESACDDAEETAKGVRVVVAVGKAFALGDSVESSKKMQRVFMVAGVVIVFMVIMVICDLVVSLAFLQNSAEAKIQ